METKDNFFNVIDWLYQINGKFGVNHVIIENQLYWLNTNYGRDSLYELYLQQRNNQID